MQRIIVPSFWAFVTLAFACALSCTLGAIAADAPITPDLNIPPAEKLAEDLGYKPTEFKQAVEDFATSLSQGSRGQAFHRFCARDEESCRLVADFHDQASDAKRERMHRRPKVKRFRITEANVAQAQRFDFPVLVNSLKVEDEYRLFALAEKSLKVGDCPRNLSAALAIKAEEFFPFPKARALSRELFQHARQCLSEDDVIYERLFLRQGLYAYYDGEKDKARDFLTSALKSKNSTERYRVLYWLGILNNEAGIKAEDNKEWTALMAEYPLSYYSIDAAVKLKRDPLKMITERKVGGLKREVPADKELNRMIRWLEALYVYKKPTAVAKWASWIVRANDDLDVDVLHYLSTLKIASGMYRSNILMLFTYFKKNPASLNEEGLRLLYPRPYYTMVQEASRGKIDAFLVLGLIRQESGFDSQAVSRVKAKGLMQIIPQTARRLASQGHRKLLNEKDNMTMGVKYLLQLGNQFNGQAELVLAAYNAGPMKVDEWLKRNPNRDANPLLWNDLIPYMETRDYVVSILRNDYLYTRIYGASELPEEKLFTSGLVKSLLTANK
ncbi:MAG: lytic transglycosylase domain-containing protein [Bdellovibrionota bacterium]